MTTLHAYLKSRGIQGKQFAKDIGITPIYLSKLRRGHARPSLDLAARIETATGGHVRLCSWIDRSKDDEAAA
jgi:transcriptional regulator with XRE-family HTH domain